MTGPAFSRDKFMAKKGGLLAFSTADDWLVSGIGSTTQVIT